MSRFDNVAKEWDLNPRRVETARAVFSKILENIDVKDFDILDYGCGTGLISFGLFEYAGNVTGMDNSQGMIDELNRKIKISKIDNIEALLHNIEKEPLPENKFDMVVSSMTLHHIEEPDMFIKKSKESLKPNGYLCISDLFEEDGTFHSHGNDGVHHFGFTKAYIEDLYQKNGFEMIFLDTVQVIEKSKEYEVFLAIGKIVY